MMMTKSLAAAVVIGLTLLVLLEPVNAKRYGRADIIPSLRRSYFNTVWFDGVL